MMARFSLRRPALGLAALALATLLGCGGGDASVVGNVTLDGTPIDSGAITFVPEGADATSVKVGGGISNGKYSVETGRGLTPGKYKVEFNWKKKTGRKMPTGDGDPIDETKEGLPAKFNTATTYTADVKSGSQTIDFALTSK